MGGRILAAVGMVLVGVVFGALAAFLQALRWFVWGVSVPWGTVLMLLALVVLVRGAVEGMHSRWAGWALYGGWLLATVVFAAETPSGDLVLSGGTRQVVYLFGGVILGAAAATVRPDLGRAGTRASDAAR